jgi:pimeloyl-ACP methyl ester carboxylesterase
MESIALADGRRLAYEEFGDPEGRPVLYFHGYPGSRVEGRLAAEGAARRGIRLISVDRPGMGGSDFQPRRRIADWPADVAVLADALGLERFGVMGVSGGGPYTLVCAWRLPERVSAAAVVCGVGEMVRPESRRGMMLPNRILFSLGRAVPWALRPLLAPMARSMRRNPEAAMRRLMRPLPAPDRAALELPDVRELMIASAREAFRAGLRGAAWEGRLYARPWGFPLEGIRGEVHLFQGEKDVNVPPVMGRLQADAIPKCRTHFYADEGHLSLALNRQDDILEALAASAQ